MPGNVGERVRRRIERDYPPATAATVVSALEAMSLEPWAIHDDPVGRERVQAAVLMRAAGDASRIADGIALARMDWRDLLMSADLGFDDWPARVAAYLDGG